MDCIYHDDAKKLFNINMDIRKKLLDVCSPLKECFGIDYFEFDRIYEDGRVLYLCTHKTWLEFSLEGRMFDDEEHVKLCSLARNRNYPYAIWKSLKLEDTKLLSQYYEHDIWNGFTINENDQGVFNTYSFASNKQKDCIDDFFIKNLHVFERFCVYFKSFVDDFFGDEVLDCTFQGTPLFVDDTDLVNPLRSYEGKVQQFLDKTSLQTFQLKKGENSARLSKRELECLHHLSKGKTAKEIAAILQLSPRTVEQFITNIKVKTDSKFKSEILDLYNQSSLKWYAQAWDK